MTTYSKNGKRLGRPPKDKSVPAKKDVPEKRPNKGSKERVLQSVERFVDHPDALMVPPRLAAQLSDCKNLDIEPSKLFADGGKGAIVARYLARKAQVSKPPKQPAEIYDTFEAFMSFCTENTVPPTIGAWAVWNGVTLTRMNRIEQEPDRERALAFEVCKEVLRTFMEQAAWQNSLNPLLYFHSQKALFGIVEKTEVTVKVEDNASDISPEERAERVGLLTLTQGEDGVFRS